MESTVTSKLATNSSNLIEKYHLLQLSYWFGTPNAANLDRLLVVVILSSLLMILVLVLIGYKFSRNLTPPENKFINKAILTLIWFGPVGWLLIFFRLQGIVLLSARFWWLIWLLALLWGVWWLRSSLTKIPGQNQQYSTYLIKRRYFNSRKKKRR